MNICLVNPLLFGYATPLLSPGVPHGLLQIMAELKKHGHNVSLIDYSLPNQNKDYQYLNQYDVVGFSVMTPQLAHAVEMAKSIKPPTKVVWGGIHCLLDPLSILERFPSHYVISGEGEIPFVKLLQFFAGKLSQEALINERGICLNDKKVIINPPYFVENLNDLADINYHDLPNLEVYLNQWNYYFQEFYPTLQILTSRGCHWHCSFCINDLFHLHGSHYRSKSIEKIRRETEKIIDEFKIKFVKPQDEDFFFAKTFLDDWKQYASEKGFLWDANCRYNYFNDKMLNRERIAELVENGLYCISMSIEAGDEKIRNEIINKKLTDKQIKHALEIIRESVKDKLSVNTSFIAYFPGDTFASRILVIKWMKYLSQKLNIMFSGPQIYRSYPGSKIDELDKGSRKHRSLDSYINEIDATATDTSLCGTDERHFWEGLVPGFFSLRYRFHELTVDADGKNRSRIGTRKIKGIRLLKFLLFPPLMLSILLRIRLKFWKYFFEPVVCGFIYRKFMELRRM